MDRQSSEADTPRPWVHRTAGLVEALLTGDDAGVRSLLTPVDSLWISTDHEADEVLDLLLRHFAGLDRSRVRVLEGPARSVVTVAARPGDAGSGLTIVVLWQRENVVSLRCYVDERAA